jgi:hypothetical protein
MTQVTPWHLDLSSDINLRTQLGIASLSDIEKTNSLGQNSGQ